MAAGRAHGGVALESGWGEMGAEPGTEHERGCVMWTEMGSRGNKVAKGQNFPRTLRRRRFRSGL